MCNVRSVATSLTRRRHIRTIKQWWYDHLLYRFTKIGSKLFSVVLVHSNEKHNVDAIHFAESERALNISMRTYVEELDK